MQKNKVKAFMLANLYGDVLSDEAVKTIQNRIENPNSEVGKIIIRLLEEAENGEFK